MNFKPIILLGISILWLFSSCEKKESDFKLLVNSSELLKVLSEMGYEVGDNYLIINEKVQNTTSLDLSNKNLGSVEGLSYFPNLQTINLSNNQLTKIDLSNISNLTDINLSGNENLTEITGLDATIQTKTEHIVLPYSQRFAMGEVPLFVKKSIEKNAKFSAQIEASEGGELIPYYYYYVFENSILSNVFFRLLKEENFLVVDAVTADGKTEKTEALDKSEKLNLDPNTPLDMEVTTTYMKHYNDLEFILNHALKFSKVNLRSFKITTSEAKKLEKDINLDLSGYDKLETISIDNVPLASLILGKNPALKNVAVKRTQIESAIVRPHTISELDFSDVPNLESLHLEHAPITKVVFPANFAPVNIHLNSIPLENIEKFNGEKIEKFIAHSANITQTPDFGEALKTIDLQKTKVKSVNISKSVNLTELIRFGENDELTEVIYPQNANIECKVIASYENKISTIDLSSFTYIERLQLVNINKRGVTGGTRYDEPELKNLTLNTESLIAKASEKSIQINVDDQFLKNSTEIKKLFDAKTANSTLKINLTKHGWFQYCRRGNCTVYEGYYNNNGAVKAEDFTTTNP